MSRRKRDIYRNRFDPAFRVDQDVDLAHLRELMTKETVDAVEYNYYGLYITNIIKIVLNSHWFRGYPDDVKDDMMSEALIDTIKARTKFDGEKYTQPTAVFNYIWRIAYHSCQHVLVVWYRMQNRMVPASQCGKGTKLSGGGDYDEDILNKALTDWDEVAEHLQDNPTVTTVSNPSGLYQ